MTRTLTAILLGLCAAPASADYVLSLEAKGQRDYYCQITVALENRTAETLTEISGFFHSYSDGSEVGHSKGAWFMKVPPGARSEATF